MTHRQNRVLPRLALLAAAAVTPLATAAGDFFYDFSGLTPGQSIIGQDGWVIIRDHWDDAIVEAAGGCGGFQAMGDPNGSSAKGAQRAMPEEFTYSCADTDVRWRLKTYSHRLGGGGLRDSRLLVSFEPAGSPETVFNVVFGSRGDSTLSTQIITSGGSLSGDVLLDDTCYEIELRVDFSVDAGLATLAYRNVTAGETDFTADTVLQDVPLFLTREASCLYRVYHVAVRLDGRANDFRSFADDLFLQAPDGSDPDACRPCPADLDCDGDVSFADILLVLGAWGEVDAQEDLDGSGRVDFGDLLIVLGDWGACGEG